jgi:hypothetical protein
MAELFDLPSEIINLIVGYLRRPSDVRHCSCFVQEDHNRQLVLHDRYGKAYETDAVHFGKAHPFIRQCIANGGWQSEIDVLCFEKGEGLCVIPCVPEEFRGMVRCVIVS